jgi:hypothetical protein
MDTLIQVWSKARFWRQPPSAKFGEYYGRLMTDGHAERHLEMANAGPIMWKPTRSTRDS